jgi:hypothetical protein
MNRLELMEKQPLNFAIWLAFRKIENNIKVYDFVAQSNSTSHKHYQKYLKAGIIVSSPQKIINSLEHFQPDEFSQVIFDEGDYGTVEKKTAKNDGKAEKDQKEEKNKSWDKIVNHFKGHANIFRVSATHNRADKIPLPPCVSYLYKVKQYFSRLYNIYRNA